MLIIGVTGGTGGGKTTVLEELNALGAYTIDCDALYHELLFSSDAMLSEIEAEFGGVVSGGALDRKALGEIVFRDKKALERLNKITHRYVSEEVEKRLKAAEDDGKTVAGIDAIALIESGLSKICRRTIGVIAPKELRARRITAREGISMEYALMRINAQKPDEFFIKNCDYILKNDYATVEEFRPECRKLLINIILTEGGTVK